MSLYHLASKPGFEGYTIQVGWNPHRTLFANAIAGEGSQPGLATLGLTDDVLDPAIVVAAVAPYAVIPKDLVDRLRADLAAYPPRR